MSKYTFTFKKDDVFVEFYSADKDVVEKQFQIWVKDADDYVNNRPFIRTAPEKTEKEEEGKMSRCVESNDHASTPPRLHASDEIQSEQPEVFDQASSLLKTINTIQNEQEGIVEEQKYEPMDFDSVLEKSIENPTFEPNKNQDKVFLNLIKSKNTADKFHYLMITAYYLSEFEKLDKFSIKQINAKLMQNLSEVVDHITLQEAINQNFIELLPDLTETSEGAEYRLTRSGEEFFAKI